MVAVVADTSPLIALSAIGRIDLLGGLAGHVLIPPAVYREIVTQGTDWVAAEEIHRRLAEQSWCTVQAPVESALLDRLRRQLGAGEAEALALAKERGLPILLDDSKARRIAQREGIEFFGTLAVLTRSKHSGRIVAAAPLVQEMREAGIHFGDELIKTFLKQLGEWHPSG